ncbi:MAG TPA: hypothetical protein VGU20_26830 [Stellaceae bacterium]|nr:hypothetical protein [Stellaceae bacterium]
MGFEIEDLYFNFESLPEYPGPLPGRIALEDVEQLAVDFRAIQAPLRVDEFSVEEQGQARLAVTITFWPTGKIEANCGRIIFPDISLPPAKVGT